MKAESEWDMGYRCLLPAQLRQRLTAHWSDAPDLISATQDPNSGEQTLSKIEQVDAFLVEVVSVVSACNRTLWVEYWELLEIAFLDRGICDCMLLAVHERQPLLNS